MTRRSCLFLTLCLSAATSLAGPADSCPDAVKTSIARAFAKSSITKCKAERENGRDQFEVVVAKDGGAVAEVDVLPDGTILQVEEKIAVEQLPKAVAKAFAAKYPKAKPAAAEKQTPTKGAPTYEIKFGGKEATFTEDGKFVEEE
jgi:hypothetical protein